MRYRSLRENGRKPAQSGEGKSLASLVKIKVSQVHLPFGRNVNGQHTLPFWQLQFEQVWRDIPVVPLPPGDGVGCVERRGYRHRCTAWLPIHVDADASASIRGVKQIRVVDSFPGNLNCQVEPLSGLGSADVLLVLGGLN